MNETGELTPQQLIEIQARRADAMNEITALCKGERIWTMCIPPQASDSDMVITNSLNDVRTLLDHSSAQEAEKDAIIESADALIDEQDARIRKLEAALRTIQTQTRLTSDETTLGTAIRRLIQIWDVVEEALDKDALVMDAE